MTAKHTFQLILYYYYYYCYYYLLQSGAVFAEPAAGRRGSGRARRRNLPAKAQRRLQRKADNDYVVEGGEGLARSTTMPW